MKKKKEPSMLEPDELNETVTLNEFEEDELLGDYKEGEALSAYDAALIYQSYGYDEDYMFGYSHEELLAALE